MPKFTYKDIVQLVQVRNSTEMKTEFRNSKKNSYKLKELWEKIKFDAGLTDFPTAIVIKRYNDLLATFREHLANNRKSGAGTVNWKYWELFRMQCDEGREVLPPLCFDSQKCEIKTTAPENSLIIDDITSSSILSYGDTKKRNEITGENENESEKNTKQRKKKISDNDIIMKFVESSCEFKREIKDSLVYITQEYKKEILSIKDSIERINRDIEISVNEKFEIMNENQRKTNEIISNLMENLRKHKSDDCANESIIKK